MKMALPWGVPRKQAAREVDMKKKSILLVIVLALSLAVSGCAFALSSEQRMFSEETVFGLTSAQVIETYGAFDRRCADLVNQPEGPDGDGLYRNYSCGYLVAKPNYSFFGNRFAKYFMIHFDENGIADRCEYVEVA